MILIRKLYNKAEFYAKYSYRLILFEFVYKICQNCHAYRMAWDNCCKCGLKTCLICDKVYCQTLNECDRRSLIYFIFLIFIVYLFLFKLIAESYKQQNNLLIYFFSFLFSYCFIEIISDDYCKFMENRHFFSFKEFIVFVIIDLFQNIRIFSGYVICVVLISIPKDSDYNQIVTIVISILFKILGLNNYVKRKLTDH